jgi:predicted NBD/HSP70 family sugar kinase
MIAVNAQLRPKLDPNFLPASLWNAAYLKAAKADAKCRPVRISIERTEGNRWVYNTHLAPDSPAYANDNLKYCERLIKFLLWAWGGSCVRIAGAPEIVAKLQRIYSKGNARAFDADFMGPQCFGQNLNFESAPIDSLSGSDLKAAKSCSDSLKGNRIGFDLGGSDRKCAAVIDGEVVFSEEIKWSPYFESDPSYHRSGIEDSLRRAAAHLPCVDAIGGSAAGIYIDNEPRVGSLFRGIPAADFDRHIRPIFKELKQQWNNIPFEIANDGDVTAIAGAMTIKENAVLGISMGTSQAVGYIDPNGKVTGWLNELAFAPVDYRDDAPIDEWSGDIGCGVQYFSQQAVGRLLPLSGIQVSADAPLPEKLELVQEKIRTGDERAAAIYETIGTYFGYSIAHYSEFYDFKNLLVLGRVSSGQGGEIILEQSRKVLELEFPELNDSLKFQTPDEKMKRHGQAVAAASLPSL